MGTYTVERSFQTSFPRHRAGGVVYLKQSNWTKGPVVPFCRKGHLRMDNPATFKSRSASGTYPNLNTPPLTAHPFHESQP